MISAGNEVRVAYFGLRDEPVIDLSVGRHATKMTYDERGNRIASEYYGVDGQRCLTKDAYAKETAEYDQRGNEVRVAYFGLRDEPVIDQSVGRHMVKESYDERGNRIALEFYGVDGQRCLTKDGYAKLTIEYDERGNKLKVASFGLRDEPVISQSGGHHAVKNSYDERGNRIAREFYGVDGQRCLTKVGYAKMTANYDDRGLRLEQVEFDLTGKSTVKKYGRGGEEIEEAYFGRNG